MTALLPPMRPLYPLGRIFFAIALVGGGVQHFIYRDFVLGRGPAWPASWPGQTVIADLTGLLFIVIGLAHISRVRAATPLALAGAVVVLVWALGRQLIVWLPHVDAGIHLTEAGKALTYVGGLIALGGLARAESRTADRPTCDAQVCVGIGRVCLGVFMIDSGVQHFQWAQFVATLVPTWIGHGLFWTYAAGVFLIAGGLGMILPWTARLAAACSGLMIFLWFLLLHLPRTIALPHSESDWLALFESLGFAGLALVYASVAPAAPASAREPAV
jgi:uncharacterized membrane protein